MAKPYKVKRLPNPLRVDPTRTATLRRTFLAVIRRGYARLRASILVAAERGTLFGPTVNVFCPTGEGGGVDPSCSPGGSNAASSSSRRWEGLGGTQIVDKGVKVEDGGANLSARLHTGREMNIPGHGVIETTGPVVFADATREKGQMTLTKVHADEELRGKGLAQSVVGHIAAVALKEGLPLRTTGVFSDAGRKMMEGMVKGGLAKKLPNGDYELDREQFTKVTANAAAVFDSSDSRVKQFRGWLREQMDSDLAGDALIQKYIDASWKKGAARSYDDVKRRGTRGRFREQPSPLPPSSSADYLRGTRDQFLRSIAGRQPTKEKVKLLASRTFSELEDVNARMATKMTRVLVDGLVQGARPRDIARKMMQEVDIEASRAEAIVRTELVRAHAEGQLDSLADLDIAEVTAEVEWVTAGDGKVCPECSPMEGAILTLDDARGMIPRHTNCRCAWLPRLVDDVPAPPKSPTTNAAQQWLAANGWVTKDDGQHIFIDDATGEVRPSGPAETNPTPAPAPKAAHELEGKIALDYSVWTPGGMQSKEVEVKTLVGRLLGPNVTPHHVAEITGAIPGAEVKMWEDNGKLAVVISHSGYSASRSISKDDQGRIVLHNEEIEVLDQGKGLGTKIFNQQVQAAAKSKVSRIEAYCARDDDPDSPTNGYYTWPRLGYDAKLTAEDRVPSRFKADRVSDLMKTDEGRAWWKKKGKSKKMEFDLTDGSLSREVLQHYVAAKAKIQG